MTAHERMQRLLVIARPSAHLTTHAVTVVTKADSQPCRMWERVALQAHEAGMMLPDLIRRLMDGADGELVCDVLSKSPLQEFKPLRNELPKAENGCFASSLDVPGRCIRNCVAYIRSTPKLSKV